MHSTTTSTTNQSTETLTQQSNRQNTNSTHADRPHNELALYLFNRNPNDDIQLLQLIESYCETECCFQYVRTTQTKTKFDQNIINTIEVYRGPRSINTNDMVNETYI